MRLVSDRLFANLREIVGHSHFALEAGTMREVIAALLAEHPALRPVLCDDDGETSSYITPCKRQEYARNRSTCYDSVGWRRSCYLPARFKRLTSVNIIQGDRRTI